MDDFASAFIGPLGEIQRQELGAAEAPFRLEHLKALSELAKTKAAGAQLHQSMEQAGMKALEGLSFDQKDPAKSLFEMGSRLMPVQPLLSEKVFAAASLAEQRQMRAEQFGALAVDRKMKTAAAKVQAVNSAYGNLSSTSPEMLELAREVFRQEMQAAGAEPAEINSAIGTVEQAIKTRGPEAIKYFHDSSMKTLDKLRAFHMQQQEEIATKRLAETERHNIAVEDRLATAEARRAAKAEADVKAGGGVKSPKADPRPRLVVGQVMKMAASLVNGDEDLKTAEDADKFRWANTIGQKAIEKVDGSYADRLRNPNLPLKPLDLALHEAIEDLRPSIRRDPTALQKFGGLLGLGTGKGPAKEVKEQPNITEEAYKKLKKGDKFWFNGKEAVKE